MSCTIQSAHLQNPIDCHIDYHLIQTHIILFIASPQGKNIIKTISTEKPCDQKSTVNTFYDLIESFTEPSQMRRTDHHNPEWFDNETQSTNSKYKKCCKKRYCQITELISRA